MWPFRRRLSVSSPELVSAVPISQDEVIDLNNTTKLNYAQTENISQEKVVNWTANSPPSASTSTRKSISTWGRKVGKKWDEIKRSDSSELLSVSSRRRHWSPNSNDLNNVVDDSAAQNSTTFLRPKRILRVKSLRHLFRYEKNQGEKSSTIDDSKRGTIQEEESYSDYKIDKSLSDGIIRIPSSYKTDMHQETLSNKKRMFSHSIQNIDKHNELGYFVNNTDTIRPKIDLEVSKAAAQKQQTKCESVTDLTKHAFNISNDNKERNEQRKSVISNGLEDLVNNMKIGCDESGYDSDSTRTGADSPDCEKSNLKARSGSITSEDYRSIEMTVPKIDLPETKIQSLDSNSEKSVNESISVPDAVETELNEDDLDATLRDDENDLDKTLTANFNKTVRFDLDDSMYQSQTPKKKISIRHSDGKLLRKKCKNRDSATISLLDETASPCKETPPIHKVLNSGSPTIPYSLSKRTRANLDVSFQEPVLEQAFKRPAVDYEALQRIDSIKKSLFKIEYKMLKLNVKSRNLGVSITEKENGRSGYIISRIDPKGDAAKSGLFHLGDEVVRVNGKRLRRISIADAKNVLQSCSGEVEIYVGRQPSMLKFTEENQFDWPESTSSTSSVTTDEEIWSRKDSGTMDTSCEIVGFHRKDGKFLSVDNFGEMEEPKEKVTGMKKFHVRKRVSNIPLHPRRALSLSMDTLTIVMEKGVKKKLGFSIVGGSDSEKGNYGIYVKNIIPDGQAENCLQTGDEILAINGVSMHGLTHAQALQTIKATKSGEIIVHVRRRDSAHLKRLHK